MSPFSMRRWKSLWYFLSLSIILSLMLTYMAVTLALPHKGIRAANAESPNTASQPNNNFVLTKGQALAVGRVLMTYEGLKTGHIVINVTPADTDAGYAYRRDIPLITAEKGFWLARQYYRLISADRSKLEIVRIRI